MSTPLRVWYSAVFAVGAAAIAGGAVLAHPSTDTASARPVETREIVLVSTNPTISQKAAASANQKWQSSFSSVMGRLQDALKSFNAAAKGQDFATMQQACGRIGTAARDMEATLPAPRRDLSAAIEGAVGNFQAAGAKCGTLTADAGQSALQAVLNDVQAGVASMQQASGILSDAGAPDNPEPPNATPLPPHVPMGGIN